MVGSKLTTKGQTTIPKEIREYLGLQPGDRVIFIRRDGDVIVRPLKKSLLDLRGSVSPKRKPEDFEEIRKRVKRKVARKATHGHD
jgi:AbrB family looped-hinge helix DNA binding protein